MTDDCKGYSSSNSETSGENESCQVGSSNEPSNNKTTTEAASVGILTSSSRLRNRGKQFSSPAVLAAATKRNLKVAPEEKKKTKNGTMNTDNLLLWIVKAMKR
jgi:hypothetical protein